jgi:hypothetical protein
VQLGSVGGWLIPIAIAPMNLTLDFTLRSRQFRHPTVRRGLDRRDEEMFYAKRKSQGVIDENGQSF